MPPDAAIPGRNKVAATAAAIQPIRMGNLSATTTAANTRQNRPTTARGCARADSCRHDCSSRPQTLPRPRSINVVTRLKFLMAWPGPPC